jgi:hypothetical protein
MNEAFSEPSVRELETGGFLARIAGVFRGAGAGLFVGLALLPTLMGLGIVICFFAGWGGGVEPVLIGGVAGVASWYLISVLFLRRAGNVRTADSAAYQDLIPRLTSLKSQLDDPSGARDPRGEAGEHVAQLERALRPRGKRRDDDSPLLWLGGYGYISLWRHVHRAEEVLLENAPPAELRIAARQDVARLRRTSVDSSDVLGAELRRLLDDPAPAPKPKVEAPSPDTARAPAQRTDARLDTLEGRALVREARYVLNCYRDDLRQGLVLLRNLMFETMVYTGFVCVGLLALAVGILGEDYEDHIATALAYYMIGALVGLFAELYVRSRRSRGIVHDYGLAHARVLTVPVLSGIAAVGGVVLARLGGTAGTGDGVELEDVFLLGEYPFGVVVAAIFGLTPGLLLARLRTETDEYQKALAESGPSQVAAESDSGEPKSS